MSQLEDIQHCLTKAQEKIEQHCPWYNPLGIDWNIRPPGPQWSLTQSQPETEGWYIPRRIRDEDFTIHQSYPESLSEALHDVQQTLEEE